METRNSHAGRSKDVRVNEVYQYHFTRRKVAESPATIHAPHEAMPVIRAMIGDRETEALLVVWLSARNSVVGTEIVYTGNVSTSLVRVAEVFRGAVRVNASGIIVAHNHPSGDPTPSPDDLHLTAEVIAAGRLLGIEVLDHLVIGDDSYVSLRDRGVVFDRTPPRSTLSS
jgi:DNA repair protein RadC